MKRSKCVLMDSNFWDGEKVHISRIIFPYITIRKELKWRTNAGMFIDVFGICVS